MKKKIAAFVLCMFCLLSATGCAQKQNDITDTKAPSATTPAPSATTTVQEQHSDDYLTTISGTYVELFPELSKDEYRTIWIDATTPLVGAENAETATDMLPFLIPRALFFAHNLPSTLLSLPLGFLHPPRPDVHTSVALSNTTKSSIPGIAPATARASLNTVS